MFLLDMVGLLLCLFGLYLLASPEAGDMPVAEQRGNAFARPVFLNAYFRQFARDLSLDESDLCKTLARAFC